MRDGRFASVGEHFLVQVQTSHARMNNERTGAKMNTKMEYVCELLGSGVTLQKAADIAETDVTLLIAELDEALKNKELGEKYIRSLALWLAE